MVVYLELSFHRNLVSYQDTDMVFVVVVVVVPVAFEVLEAFEVVMVVFEVAYLVPGIVGVWVEVPVS